MKENLIKTLVKFGELSAGACCLVGVYEPEVPFELQAKANENSVEDIYKK